MERTQVLELMGTLKLYGMRGAYDEVMATGIKRQHEPPRIVGDLLSAEIAEKQARSIKYRSQRISMSSTSTVRLSTRCWSGTLPTAPSSPTSATPCLSAAPEPASRIWQSPLPAP